RHTFVAPQAPRRLSPSSPALSVSHTASVGPPNRVASPSTSAITFFGIPLRSSSTTHQIAPGIVAPYCLRVRSLSLLRGARARVPSPRSTRHPGSPRRGAAPPFRHLPPHTLFRGQHHR